MQFFFKTNYQDEWQIDCTIALHWANFVLSLVATADYGTEYKNNVNLDLPVKNTLQYFLPGYKSPPTP